MTRTGSMGAVVGDGDGSYVAPGVDSALRLSGVSVTREGVRILDGVSFWAPRGGVTALVGPNGAGKSTVLRVVVGAERADEGEVVLCGRSTSGRGLRELSRERAMVTQQHGGGVDFTVEQVVEVGRTAGRGVLSGGRSGDAAAVWGALEATGTSHLAGRVFSTLSGGEQQRVLVARAVAQGTPVVLLDEPTNHLDLSSQFSLLELVAGLSVTVVMAVHDLNLALRYASHVVVMDRGGVVAEGVPEVVLTCELIRSTFGVEVDRIIHPRTGEHHLLFSGR
ncbi:ABC transporter ATP-binding protein [Corynebacterium kroppenstedtii]|uniref:ABC transporter ATP-binding protein n=1 Tax=Corynebacterium sp. PCR 32 TaxID=3351342 RepID=UPI0030AB87F4